MQQTWFQIPAKTRIETEHLVSQARDNNLKAFSTKVKGNYYSLIYGTEEQKDNLVENYIPPEIPKDYEEDINYDLNLFLKDIRRLRDEREKMIAAKLFALELKRLTDRKKIITLFIPDRKYVSKIGTLLGDKFDEAILQVSGDYRGMTVWNNILMKDVEKIRTT